MNITIWYAGPRDPNRAPRIRIFVWRNGRKVRVAEIVYDPTLAKCAMWRKDEGGRYSFEFAGDVFSATLDLLKDVNGSAKADVLVEDRALWERLTRYLARLLRCPVSARFCSDEDVYDD